MSRHMAFRRQPMPQEYAQALKTITIPAPTRGIVWSENEAFMAPGAAIVQENWFPTMRGCKLRGGTIRYCDLHALDGTVPPIPSPLRKPVLSAFEYVSGNTQKMFAAQDTKLFDVTSSTPVLVKGGQTSGNYAASQLANLAGYWMLVVNETGDPVLRFNGSSWVVLDASVITAWANNTAYAIGALARDTTDSTYWRCTVAHTSAVAGTFAADRAGAASGKWASTASDSAAWITGPAGTPVQYGKNLSYVCKYRSRYFFIETKSMNLWYLPIDSPGGTLTQIPMSGAATKGGYLMFLASWSIDAGDGIDDKLIAVTSEGEVLVFTGSDPGSAATWRQEGRYQIPAPLGMNAWLAIGGDVLIATVEGIVPISAAITKDSGQLELAMITRPIKPLWRDDVTDKRGQFWSMEKWDENGALLVASPGGLPGKTHCWAANNATGAWCTLTYDAMCWVRLRGDLFFGDQRGLIMQAERTGMDDGNAPNAIDRKAYNATLVGGWEMFQSRSQQVVWHQARAIFTASQGEPFQPQLSATTDFVVVIPQPPPPGPDPGLLEVWDQGLWDQARWDQPGATQPVHRNTMWVSIGMTGFSHAPIVQVAVAQKASPVVELVAIAATFEQAGVNV